MQTTTEQIIYLPSPRIPASTCPYEADLPHPYLPTSHRLNVSHPRAKYLNLVHASQSPVSARIISKSRSRRSLLRSIYLAFLPRHRQMIPSCFMAVSNAHARQFQQTPAKRRYSRAHLPAQENDCRHSITAHSISPFQASLRMSMTTRTPTFSSSHCSTLLQMVKTPGVRRMVVPRSRRGNTPASFATCTCRPR